MANHKQGFLNIIHYLTSFNSIYRYLKRSFFIDLTHQVLKNKLNFQKQTFLHYWNPLILLFSRYFIS